MIVHVTQKHINCGTRLKCDKCPVTLALNEATGKKWTVNGVRMNYRKWFSLSGYSKDFETPLSVTNKIIHYDRTGEMEPFSFELEGF